jgi:hypothetical protein
MCNQHFTLAEMLEGNAADEEFCEWARTAQPGDVYSGIGERCECVAPAHQDKVKGSQVVPNPPAFPHTGEGLGVECATLGMSLRDYFAAKAMHAELATAGMDGPAAMALLEAAEECGMTPVQRIAFNAYELADAMLAERAKGDGV